MLTPKLRFKDFKENWNDIELGELLSFKNGINAAKEDYGFGYKFINVLDIIQNDFITHDSIIGEVNITESDFEKNKVEYGDILFQRSSETREEVGQANVYLDKDNPATFGGFVIRGKMESDYNPSFLNCLLKTSSSRKEITTKSGGSTRFNVSQGTLSEVKINLPSLPEQQKIADFFSTVDKKIQALSKRKELLESYKRGVMQQIFKQEIRFKDADGSDYPDWEEKRLGDVTKYSDGTHQTPKYTKTGVPFYSVEHVTANDFSKTKFISEEVWLKENKRVKLEREDILMTRIGNIGTPRLLDWDVRASFYVSLALIKANESFNSSYLTQFIQSQYFQKQLWRRTIHVAFPQKINLGEIGKCLLLLPSIEEQAKIANFLSAIDDKINTVGSQVEKMKEWKKGLLQQMFV